MTDGLDEGPDPNDLRRHAKRMFTEMQYRQKYRRIDFYRPNRKQFEFHNTVSTELMLRANNQGGKTHAAGAQMTFDALRYYPEWYEGRRFEAPPKIERPFDFLGWCAAPTSVATRDGAQTKLLGDLTQGDGLGTGLIPLDNIVGKPAMARGIADFADSVTLTREGGGRAVIRFKTYEMERRAFQGEPVDQIWVDEDDKNLANIYGEMLARLTTTRGQIRFSATPVLGLTPVRKRYKTGEAGAREIVMTIDDCRVSNGGHIPDEDIPAILARFKPHELQTRAYGADMQGEGAVFETPAGQIKFVRDWRDFPPNWRWMWGVDFRHSGSISTGHPFAAVLGARDPDTDAIYVVTAIRMLGLAPMHVAAMKAHPMWPAPVAWPHDGGRGGSLVTGETIAQTYRKLGLRMRQTHATFERGGFGFEDGVTEMTNRLATGRLKVAAHLAEWFDEYQGYHRVNGLVNKVDDDLLSATRQLCMDIRFAKPVHEFAGFDQRSSGGQVAAGVDFDVLA